MPDYGYKVVSVDPKLLTDAGYGVLSHQPFILDPEPGYARLPNQFLIDRGLGYWDPKWRGQKRNPIPPSRISMRNFAHWLANVLEWADTRSIDLMHGDYVSDLIGRYQQEMLKGIWSADNRPLAPETVNPRVQIALEFQMWAADKGLREPFVIPTTTTYISNSHDNSRSHEVKVVQSRKGTILAQLVRHGALTPEMEARLKEYRALMKSRVGAGCSDPRHPPEYVAPNHVPGRLCGTNRCLKDCHNAKFLPESMDGIAMRVEELLMMLERLPRETFLLGGFDMELDSGEYLLDTLYPAEAVSLAREKWRKRIASGEHIAPGLGHINQDKFEEAA